MGAKRTISLVAAGVALHAVYRGARNLLPRGEEMPPSWGSYLLKRAAQTWRSRST